MNNHSSGQDRIKCPFCAELILPDAKICRFCRSDLTGKASEGENKTSSTKPGLIRAMVLNLFCPGLAAWKLGHKVRGAIIFSLVIGSLALYANSAIPVVNKALSIAVKTGNTRKLNSLTKELEQNNWVDLSFYVYAYSFLEIFYLIRKPEDSQSKEKPDEHERQGQ